MIKFKLFASLMALCVFSACGGNKPAPEVGVIEKSFNDKRASIAKVEQVAASTFTAQIGQGARQYMLLTGHPPESFSDFIIDDEIPEGSNYTLSTTALGRHGGCIVSPKVIDCSYAFEHLKVSYKWLEAGKAMAEISSKDES